MPHHDFIAALWHHGELLTGLVGPHTEAQEADAATLSNGFDLFKVPSRLSAGLVKILERCA